MPEFAEAARVLAGLQNVLIATHEKPDGDAFGSALGLAELMRDNGRRATVLLPDQIPVKFEVFGGEYRTSLAPEEFAGFDALVVLDAARESRIALGEGVAAASLAIPLFNLDHHVDNSINGKWNCVSGECAASAELVFHLADQLNWVISPRAATWLAIGIITDTGSFRFTNTTAATLRAAARLRECGADWETVINASFFSKPRNQQQFEVEMLQNCVQSAFDGRFLYALIPDELFAKYHFDMRDGEAVIDLLREIAGVTVAALVYRRNGAFKLSLRSKDERYPVGPVARAFGGGGHQMAAGATLEVASFAEAEARLLAEVGRVLSVQS